MDPRLLLERWNRGGPFRTGRKGPNDLSALRVVPLTSLLFSCCTCCCRDEEGHGPVVLMGGPASLHQIQATDTSVPSGSQVNRPSLPLSLRQVNPCPSPTPSPSLPFLPLTLLLFPPSTRRGSGWGGLWSDFRVFSAAGSVLLGPRRTRQRPHAHVRHTPPLFVVSLPLQPDGLPSTHHLAATCSSP